MQRQINKEHLKKWENLQIFADENGLLRCHGRIRGKDLPRDILEPIILPPKHPVTNLFVKDAHVRCAHQGVNATLANIRLRYWIPKGRQVVRNCLRNCVVCRRWNGKPYFYPESPSLPHFRVKPALIISDNATNFKLGSEIISSFENETSKEDIEIHNFLANEKIVWKFITPLSPWKGGFYERIIGVMKLVIRKTTGRKILRENDFQTLIIETEAMVNSRPLTYAGSTVEDSLVLRPVDLLIPQASLNVAPPKRLESEIDDPEYLPSISTKQEAQQYFQSQQNYIAKLWKHWNENYLLELRNFHQKRIKQKSFTRKESKVGEVVLVMDEMLGKDQWQLGLVLELIKDVDGKIRSVKLRTGKSILERSINMLIPVEIEDGNNEPTVNNNKEVHEETNRSNNAENFTTTPAGEPSMRQRPFLPRRAKQNKRYGMCVSTNTNETTTTMVPRIRWHRWLMLTLIVSLCPCARTENDQPVQLRCVKGGIDIGMMYQYTAIEVCGNDHCFEVKQPERNFTIQFPPEITLHTYHVAVKSLHGSRAQHHATQPRMLAKVGYWNNVYPSVFNSGNYIYDLHTLERAV
ncbi:hypothetical protein OESDEN_14068 [Oesophagostomum dentatum]|uniref:Integrase catalytic domain-containing protein n=1 Tax=Oesophagostomum dentatum TaxID=61180 RepID=A0A0B1SSN7_OESDE|nr:hypothetical protein OESDEN_14068 [Oesophagostomum dentatum]